VAERSGPPGELELEAALVDLGRHLAYPSTPDLAAHVRRGLAQRPVRRRSFWAAIGPLQRRVAVAVLALVVAVAGAVLAISPEARTAVADRLGLRGVQIREIPAVPTPPPAATPTVIVAPPLAPTASPVAASPARTIGPRLNLGQPSTLSQVRAQVTFTVLVPAALGPPDEVYLLDAPSGGQVALVYYPRPDLPQAHTTSVGVLLTEFQGDIHSSGAISKGLPPGSKLEAVQVNGGPGYWIDGDPHVFFYLDARGQMQTETTRLAGNVLLWEQGELTLRLESVLPRDAALHIAASVH
jgi:hypothetical protein